MAFTLPPVRLTGQTVSAKPRAPRKKRWEHRIAANDNTKQSLKALGQELAAYRTKHALSQRAMAAKVGCSWQIISHLECVTGDAPSYAVYMAMRKVLDGRA